MLCAGDGHVDAVVLLNEVAWLRTHHRDEHDVEFSTLRAVNRDYLFFHALGGVKVSDCVFLRVIRCDNVNPAFLETLLWNTWNLLVDFVDIRKLLETDFR